MLNLKAIMNEIDNNTELTEDQKGFAHYVFANRPGYYFLKVAVEYLKKDVETLLKMAQTLDRS